MARKRHKPEAPKKYIREFNIKSDEKANVAVRGG